MSEERNGYELARFAGVPLAAPAPAFLQAAIDVAAAADLEATRMAYLRDVLGVETDEEVCERARAFGVAVDAAVGMMVTTMTEFAAAVGELGLALVDNIAAGLRPIHEYQEREAALRAAAPVDPLRARRILSQLQPSTAFMYRDMTPRAYRASIRSQVNSSSRRRPAGRGRKGIYRRAVD